MDETMPMPASAAAIARHLVMFQSSGIGLVCTCCAIKAHMSNRSEHDDADGCEDRLSFYSCESQQQQA